MSTEAKHENNIVSIDLIVNNLDAASDFIELITEPQKKERVPGFSCYSFYGFDVMLSESALVDMGKVSGLILHVRVPDVDERVQNISDRAGLLPQFGPENTDWGTYSAIYNIQELGFSIDIFTPVS